MESVNPATGEIVKVYKEHSLEDLEHLVHGAHQAFLQWRWVSLQERGTQMRKAAAVLRRNKERYGRLITEEMGKPIQQSYGEIEKCAVLCEFYAERAEDYLKPEMISTEASKSFIAFEPLGLILAIMPWNFPFWQAFRCAVPTMMAGNGVILKHAANVSGCALAIEEVFKEAEFPSGLMTSVIIGVPPVARLIEHSLIHAIALTGSTHAGRDVAAKAGAVIKKCVLELGGSDPYIILEDADLETAIETCVASRMINTGQSCIAAKRFIVHESVIDHFTEGFIARMNAQKSGNPMSNEVTMGPLARRDLRDGLHAQVEKSISQGASCAFGGHIANEPGAFYPPTVLTNVQPHMTAYKEELFGPVASIIKARSEQEAIHIANSTVFGLGAAVFSKDLKRAERIAQFELEAGCCFVNQYVRSDPRLPFGGIKQSGYGRELSSFGIREFVNVKTIYIR